MSIEQDLLERKTLRAVDKYQSVLEAGKEQCDNPFEAAKGRFFLIRIWEQRQAKKKNPTNLWLFKATDAAYYVEHEQYDLANKALREIAIQIDPSTAKQLIAFGRLQSYQRFKLRCFIISPRLENLRIKAKNYSNFKIETIFQLRLSILEPLTFKSFETKPGNRLLLNNV